MEYIIIGVVVVLVLAFIAMFNGFVAKRNRVQDAWAQIDVQLKRRYDLIPNLIETVKGYMKYEKSTLTQITQLRSQLVSGSVQDKAQANNMLSQALKTLFANVENYPNLKASDTMQNLQEELENTENKISYVRTSYNDYVLDYNNAIQQFPGNAFAGMFGFSKQDFFQAPEEAKEPVKVDFSDAGSGTPPKAPQKKQKR
ncbi:MAG: LemA family protein [Candidatus Micrarchaeota archaeon]|nr:LemA family protein [Candidatus Micrarchaeota archaeon]MDE1849767.1 LemA family protein [Candidatus Micrarchaeota archaeon]